MRSLPASRRFLPPFLPALGLLAAAGLLSGCPGGGSLDDSGCYTAGGCGSGGGAATFCDAQPVFAQKCGGSLCHGSSTANPPGGGVELVTAPAGMTLGQSLFNKAATYPGYPMGTCPPATPEIIIDGTTPAESLLLKKLDVGFLCGEKMPPAPVTLSVEERACINEWVNGIAQTGGI